MWLESNVCSIYIYMFAGWASQLHVSGHVNDMWGVLGAYLVKIVLALLWIVN